MYKSECKILTSKIDVNLKFINPMNFTLSVYLLFNKRLRDLSAFKRIKTIFMILKNDANNHLQCPSSI